MPLAHALASVQDLQRWFHVFAIVLPASVAAGEEDSLLDAMGVIEETWVKAKVSLGLLRSCKAAHEKVATFCRWKMENIGQQLSL